jgi:hypothetical protein
MSTPANILRFIPAMVCFIASINLCSGRDLTLIGNIDHDANDEIVFFNKTNTGGIIRAIDPITGVNDAYLYYIPVFSDFIDVADKAFLGDVNNDNRDELILINSSSYTGKAILVIDIVSGSIILQIDHGGFYNLLDANDKIFIEDVDGNGTDDLILINRSNGVIFLKVIDLTSGTNIKTINYSDLYPNLNGWIDESDRIFVGRVNGNNLLDLVFMNTSYSSGAIRVLEIMTATTIKWINHGAFTDLMDQTDRIFLGDVNNDGKDDLVFINTSYSGNAIVTFDILGDSTMIELDSNAYAGWLDACDRIFLNDVNNDGKQDLIFINISSNAEAIRVVNPETGFNHSFIRRNDLSADGWFDAGDKILTGNFNGSNCLILINTSLSVDFIRVIDVVENINVAQITYNQIYPLMNGWFDGFDECSLTCIPTYPQGVMVFDSEHVCNGTYMREIRPRNYQLYPRNENNTGNVKISGHISGYNHITVRITKTRFDHSQQLKYFTTGLDGSGHFNFNIEIQAELSEYGFAYSLDLINWTPIAEKVVCGDAFIISGQSNASAGSDSAGDALMNNKYGNNDENVYGRFSRTCRKWGINPSASWYYSEVTGGCGVGIWGLKLQYELQKKNQVPTCFINDAVSGTSMSQHHLFNPDPFLHIFSPEGKYLMGSMLTRTYYAELQDYIKAIMWFNGEHEVCATNPIPGIYVNDFDILYNSCNQYLSRYQKMYVIQISSFIDKFTGISIVSEEQRQLPSAYDDLQVMSSNGIGDKNPEPNQHIHFTVGAYEELGRRMYNMVEKDIYNIQVVNNHLPPNIVKARYIENKIFLHFDQLLDSSKSDPIANITSVIRFNISGISIFNAGISENCIYFEVDPSSLPLIQTISYAGYLPDNDYNRKCYIRNSDSVAALSFSYISLLPEEEPNSIGSGDEISPIEIQVFPNPVKNILNIRIPASFDPNSIQLINCTGEILYQKSSLSGDHIIDCSGYPQGIFFIRIMTSTEIIKKKIVIIN